MLQRRLSLQTREIRPALSRLDFIRRGRCGTRPTPQRAYIMFSGWTIWGSNVPRLFSCFYPVAGITLWPFVFIAEEHPTPAEQEEHERPPCCRSFLSAKQAPNA